MAEPQPNPLLSHFLGALQVRQARDVEFVEILDQVRQQLVSANELARRQVELLEELAERSRK